MHIDLNCIFCICFILAQSILHWPCIFFCFLHFRSCDLLFLDVKADVGVQSIDRGDVGSIDAPDKPYPSLMSGYFKHEAAAKTLSKDGWLKTGDIDSINEINTMSIIDQRKNLFKLPSGEYINFTDRITATFSVYQSSKLISVVVLNQYNTTLSIHQLFKNSDATLSSISHNISNELVCEVFHLCLCFSMFRAICDLKTYKKKKNNTRIGQYH